jgi:hypothetical protein
MNSIRERWKKYMFVPIDETKIEIDIQSIKVTNKNCRKVVYGKIGNEYYHKRIKYIFNEEEDGLFISFN